MSVYFIYKLLLSMVPRIYINIIYTPDTRVSKDIYADECLKSILKLCVIILYCYDHKTRKYVCNIASN